MCRLPTKREAVGMRQFQPWAALPPRRTVVYERLATERAGMGTRLPVPEKTAADAELWITMEGWDGSMHQASIPLSQASPATVAWLNKQGAKP